MKINYIFNNGENSEVEVSEEIGAVILESRRKEENMERNRRLRCYSLDDVDYEGVDFADKRTPESIFMEQIDNEHIKETLDKLSETQRRRLLMYAEGMSIEDIARVEGVYHTSISRYSVGIQNGFLSPNDVRELENLDLIPDELGGNRYLCNGNMIDIGSAGRSAEPQENTDTEQQIDEQESDTNNEE